MVATRSDNIDEQVLKTVKASDDQLTAKDIVDRLARVGAPEDKVRAAMWFLVDRGLLNFTSDWRLHASGVLPK